jgi:hypothetical protein
MTDAPKTAPNMPASSNVDSAAKANTTDAKPTVAAMAPAPEKTDVKPIEEKKT